MASDRGSATELEPDELDAGVVRLRRAPPLRLRAARASRSPPPPSARSSSRAARRARSPLDVSTWTLVDDALPRARAALAPDLVFATEREQEALGPLGRSGSSSAAPRALRWTAWTIPPSPSRSSTRPAPATRSPPASSSAASQLGLEAAARCCAKLGAMP